MQKLLKIFFALMISTYFGVCYADTVCTGATFYDPDVGSCVACETPGFVINTTNLSANTTFVFSMSAKGSFVVDWGDDTIDNINRDNTAAAEYQHTYTTGGVKNIKFCGKATEYNSSAGEDVVAAISFYKASGGSQTTIASVSGSLGSVFPTIGTGENANQQPRFRSTFQGAIELTTISATLFNGVSGSADGMFRSTFDKCGKLEAIPYGLFANVSGGAPNMFRSTFYQSKGITSLPDDLFAGITVAAQDEFKFTFYQATGLTGKYIPSTAFTGLVNAGHPSPLAGNMWYQTFEGTGLRDTCPTRTHKFTTGYEGNVQYSTWNGVVSCEPDNPCVGVEYWDATEETCKTCPGDYVYDTSNTKISINECKIQCAAGTYVATAGDLTCSDAGVGYYATGDVVSYGSVSSHTKCPDNMPTINNTTTASSANQCVVYCRGLNYRDESTNSCVACPTGYDADKTNGKMAMADCKIQCDDGTYLATAGAPSCINVGDGWYAAATTVSYGSTSSRNQCPDGQMTGMVNASSSSQCIELCTGATYRDSTTGTCEPCPVGYNAHTLSGKMSINDCQIHCVAGTYIANAYDTVCTNVSDGYYAAASNVNYGSAGSRGQCPNGQTTGTQTATSSSQCQTSCEMATYYDSVTDSCQDCPTGYTDNVANGKNSIYQCQAYCAGGTYLETYTPILYLEGNNANQSGRQYIDTGYGLTGTHANGVAVVETLTTMSTSTQDTGNFFGNVYGPGGFSANWKQGNFGLWLQGGKNGSKAKYKDTFSAGRPYTITYDISIGEKKGTATLTVDNNQSVSQDQNNAIINDKGNTFKLFTNGGATRNGNTVIVNNYGDKLFIGRIYSLTLYDDNTLVLDLIPVRRERDGALGMYNRVTHEFYGNAGTGNFTAGADNGESFTECSVVGNGYYVGASYTNYGTLGTRNRCPNNSPTMVDNVTINNASSIYQCDGVEMCKGVMYPNPDTGVCTQCPTGYDFNSLDGKESVNECQTHCYAGTYLANAYDATCSNAGNGYYALEDTVNWGDAGSRTRCQNGGVTNTETATSPEQCVAVDACTGATYMNFGRCEPCPTGYTSNIIDGKTSATDCQLVCPEGSYLATANSTICTDAGVGFWATGGAVNYGSTSIKNACVTGLTTVGYGHGADSPEDCGHVLHIDNNVIYMRQNTTITPSINIEMADQSKFYIPLSDNDHNLSKLHVWHNGTKYTAYDDSLLYGERNSVTGARIQQ